MGWHPGTPRYQLHYGPTEKDTVWYQKTCLIEPDLYPRSDLMLHIPRRAP